LDRNRWSPKRSSRSHYPLGLPKRTQPRLIPRKRRSTPPLANPTARQSRGCSRHPLHSDSERGSRPPRRLHHWPASLPRLRNLINLLPTRILFSTAYKFFRSKTPRKLLVKPQNQLSPTKQTTSQVAFSYPQLAILKLGGKSKTPTGEKAVTPLFGRFWPQLIDYDYFTGKPIA